jgi:hypothetical protein
VPWDIVVRGVVTVQVGICVVVTVSIVDVTVSTVSACDLDGWVKSEWEHSVFGHQPICVDCGGKENHRTVYLHEICADVRFSARFFQNDRLRDGGQKFTGFSRADFEFTLCCGDFLAKRYSV